MMTVLAQAQPLFTDTEIFIDVKRLYKQERERLIIEKDHGRVLIYKIGMIDFNIGHIERNLRAKEVVIDRMRRRTLESNSFDTPQDRWAFIVRGTGVLQDIWNREALFFLDGTGENNISSAPNGIEINLAYMRTPFLDAPSIIDAVLVPVAYVKRDTQGLIGFTKVNQAKKYRIYSAQHVVSPIILPRFNRPLSCRNP